MICGTKVWEDVEDYGKVQAEYVCKTLVLFIQSSHDDTFSLPDELSCQVVKICRVHIKVRLWRKIGIVAFTTLSRTWYKCRVEPCRLGCP